MFNRAWLAGGIPRTACVAAYEPICAVSLADSYINRANPGTNDASAPVDAPGWSEPAGWTFNGTSDYLTTGVSPAASGSLIVRFSGGRTGGTGVSAVAGAVNVSGGVKRHYIFSQYFVGGSEKGVEYGLNGGGSSATSYPDSLPPLGTGVLALAGLHGYRDGVLEASVPSANGSSGATIGIYVGAANNDGTAFGLWSGSIQALYIYNVPLTPTQVRAVTDAMNMLPMRPRVPTFPSWMRGAALTQFRKLLGLRTGSRGVPE